MLSAHGTSGSGKAARTLHAPVLLVQLSEVTNLPQKRLPSLSLQVLRHSLETAGFAAECLDLARFAPAIAMRISGRRFQALFRHNTEYGVVTGQEQDSLLIHETCVRAVTESGLLAAVSEAWDQFKPTLVGLSIPGTPLSSDVFSAELACIVARWLKSLGQCAVVVGGARTVEKDNIRNALLSEPAIDYVVRGNGYQSIRQLASMMAGNAVGLREVRGLVYRDGNAVAENESDAPWGHLALPIWLDRRASHYYRRTIAEMVPRARYVPSLNPLLNVSVAPAPFQFTIGCVSECAFCNRASEVGKVSPPKIVVDLLERAVKEFGIQEFVFLNSELNFGLQYLHRFCSELAARKLDIRWTDSCEFRGLDGDVLRRMRDVGCVALWYGLESASDRLLAYIQKRTTVAHAREVLRIADEIGIYNCLNIICGFPYEEESDVEAMLTFLIENRDVIDTTQVNIFYLQGGPFAETPERFGLKLRGYQEQVGETTSKAFDEIHGLRWEEKRLQALGSYGRVAALADELFPDVSRNMPLILGLHKALVGDKPRIKAALNELAAANVGDFFESDTRLFANSGIYVLADPSTQQLLEVDERIAAIHDLRHLRNWADIEAALVPQFSAQAVADSVLAIRSFEAKGFFAATRAKPFRIQPQRTRSKAL